jgi:hypothetical protein
MAGTGLRKAVLAAAACSLLAWYQPAPAHAAPAHAAPGRMESAEESPLQGVIHVSNDTGVDAPGCGSADQPCKTINRAVSQAASGDSIRVAAGVYADYGASDDCNGAKAVVCVTDKQISISGGYRPGGWDTPDASTNVTTIDGRNERRGVYVMRSWPGAPQTSLVMDGFTIQNGRAQGASAGSSRQIDAFGGGVWAELAQLTLRSMIFRNNQSAGGHTNQTIGGSASGGAIAVNAREDDRNYLLTLENVVFENNQALGGNGQGRGGFATGGAIFSWFYALTGQNLRFTNNTAIAGDTPTGSGMPDGFIQDGLGGCAYFGLGTYARFQNVVAVNNQAWGGDAPNGSAGGGLGGAFYVEKGAFMLSDALLSNNLAHGGNGINHVMYAGYGEAGAIGAIFATLILDRVRIIANQALGAATTAGGYRGMAAGGGLAIIESISLITNTLIARNYIAHGASGLQGGGGGGGMQIRGSTVDMTHVTVAGNAVGDMDWQRGQGIYVREQVVPSTVKIQYGIIADHQNSKPLPWSTVALHVEPGSTVTLIRGLYANNTKNDNSDQRPSPSGAFNSLDTMATSTTAGFVWPFPPDYNYDLAYDSPARAQAIGSTISMDIKRRARLTPSAVGAYEFLLLSPRIFVPLAATGR